MNEMRIAPWQIVCDGPVTDFTESVFSLGNGEVGVRGFSLLEEKPTLYAHGIFKAGLFEQVKPGITDMAQLPDVLGLRVENEALQSVSQQLDLRRGVLTQRLESERLAVSVSRMVSMADLQLVCVRMTITALQDTDVCVSPVMDARVCNLPVRDDQLQEETETVRLMTCEYASDTELQMRMVHSGRMIRFLSEVNADRPLRCHLRKGEQLAVDKRVRVLMDGEGITAFDGDPWAAHEAAWETLWQACDIELDADERIQGALRYNLFELLCNNAAQNSNVSIGARGLTHGRYKGNTFWDTDIFLLPFYLWQRPEAARSLVYYRYDRLPAARALASRQNLSGARYPWMCSADGTEQCESWDIGLCETHITADVAYAAHRYAEVSGDQSFEKTAASEMYLETARYWLSRFTWEEKRGQYSSFFVKGPDEYCGAAINNTFTNLMARDNVRLALRYAPLSPEERRLMTHFVEHVAILYDEPRDLFLQDEAFERLEPLPKADRDGTPLYKQICFDRMQRYRALKQADLVQLMVLQPNAFTTAQKKAVWDVYEPLTVHDSTLSYGVHAHLAFQLGLHDQAWAYFKKSLCLDLEDVLHNTGREGVHMAALGASWQALVLGALGLWSENGQMTVQPNLPPQIKRIALRVTHHGVRYRIAAEGRQATVTKEEA